MENQLEIWKYLVNGGSVFLGKTEIKFKDGALKSKEKNGWKFCPIAFENPRLFSEVSK